MGFVEYIQLRCPRCSAVRDNPRANLQTEQGEFRNLVNAVGESLCGGCRAESALGVRKGDIVGESPADRRHSGSMPMIGRAARGDVVLGRACHDAIPGAEVEIERAHFTDARGRPLRQRCVVRA